MNKTSVAKAVIGTILLIFITIASIVFVMGLLLHELAATKSEMEFLQKQRSDLLEKIQQLKEEK